MKLQCTTTTGIFYGTKCRSFISAITNEQMIELNIYLKNAQGQWYWSRKFATIKADLCKEISEFPN